MMFCIVNNIVHDIVRILDNIVKNTEHHIVILSYCQYSYNIAHIVLYCQQYCKGLVCRWSQLVNHHDEPGQLELASDDYES
jgi:hypothetical protein